MPTLTVKGMSCNHCKQAVTQALEALPGVTEAAVSHEAVMPMNSAAAVTPHTLSVNASALSQR